MNTDWKDALSSLRGNLKDAGESEIPETTQPEESKTKQKSPLRIIIDKKGRNGKTATIIEGFEIDQKEVEDIAKKLKQRLGVGGSVRDGEILIQGERKDAINNILKELGFKTKL